jgi:murein DD-endopeptidase MepM/ murein hydrolase activator NlpD
MMERGIRVLVFLALLFGFLSTPLPGSAQAQTPPPPKELEAAIRSAVLNAFGEGSKDLGAPLPPQLVVDNILYSNDNRWAVVWLAQIDEATGEVIATEPGLAIARNRQGKLIDSDSWAVTFSIEAGWEQLVQILPAELSGGELQERSLEVTGPAPKAVSGPLRGYKLPWSSGLGKRMTNSIGHVYSVSGGLASCPSKCRYAYDFADGTIFPILAAKGGKVKDFYEGCDNGGSACTNYLVLEDQSTVPTTYQIYFHLAKNSVPDDLHIGDMVRQGQFIADADDTGYSTAHHLHFHVTDYLYYYSSNGQGLPWGNSVDIRFDDVAENDGTPRTCAEASEYPNLGDECRDGNVYTSGNVGTNPPSGQLDGPADWSSFTNSTLTLSGSASDDRGISRVQILANTGTGWKDIGSADYASGAFSKALNLCGTTIPRGPFSLAVRIWDREGNRAAEYTGIRQLFNHATCDGVVSPPAPACTPASNQVSLYSAVDFGGSCQKVEIGDYGSAQLGSVGNNNTASIQLGSEMCAVVYDDALDLTNMVQTGRMETLRASDRNLADNRIGAGNLSALKVGTCDGVDEPFLTFPGNRVDSDNDSRASNPAGPSSVDSLVLAWTGGEGVNGFTATLKKDGVDFLSMPQQNTHYWPVGNLPVGNYLWTVTAVGANTNSTDLNFSVSSGTLPTAGAQNAPVTYDFQAGPSNWTGSGLWGHVSLDKPTKGVTNAWLFSNGSTYADATYRAGDLTSPPITLPTGQTSYLTFKQFSDVEGATAADQAFATRFWDQRRVQLSVNGGTFTDLYQFADDVQNAVWISSPVINLGAYAGQTIRVRFHFDTIDRANNAKLGWAIDDVTIGATPPADCAADNNDTPASATLMSIGQSLTGKVICPAGDWDYYKFGGTAGQTVVVDLDARTLSPASALDSLVEIIDANGADVLATNDDETAGTMQDSLIELVLPRTGTYYLRVRAWNHPGAGGTNYLYNLNLTSKQVVVTQPALSITKPLNPASIPVVPFIVEAQAYDPLGSGVKQVDFYWHSPDWINGSWSKFATDTTSADGWWGIFSPSGDTTGSAFYYMATNKAGGTAGAALLNLRPDTVLPVSALQSLPASVNSTAVQLHWSGSDTGGLDFFELQTRSGSGSWSNWSGSPIPGEARNAWFIAAPGTYGFRLRAVDLAGNKETYSTDAETSVTLSGACTADVYDAGDGTFAGAVPLPLASAQTHTLCQNDADWVLFNAAAGQDLLMRFRSLGGGAAVSATLFNSAGQQVSSAAAVRPGDDLAMRFIPPTAGTYRMEIRAYNSALYGSDVQYAVWVGPGSWAYLPFVGR